MNAFGWFLRLLWASLFRERSTPLVRPDVIDWNPSFLPKTVQVGGHTLFYAVKGEGEPLILIHGFGGAVWVWEKQIDLLAQSRRVYAVDLVGHGFSDRPRLAYTPETYIRSFKDFMEAIGVEKATLIGNSMGGGLAWAMAGLFPERVHRLVLIDCIPPDVLNQVGNDSFKALVSLERFPFLLSLVFASRNRGSIKRLLEECVSDKGLITADVVERQYRLSKIRGTSRSLASTFRHAKMALGLAACLGRIEQPTLLIWGDQDLIFPPRVGEGLQRIIPGSTFHAIRNSGHIPMWETPDTVNKLILAFLNYDNS